MSNDQSHRLQRLEEHAGFTEHTLDQLSTEIAAASRTLRELAARMERLEARLQRMQQSMEEPTGGDESTPTA